LNGIHDMGGMQDMGPVRPEKHEPVFHATWEGRVFALDLAVPGDWTGSAERYQIELISPADYLLMSYYEKWLRSLVELMITAGMVTRAEVESGKAVDRSVKRAHVLGAADVPSMIAKGTPASRNVSAVAQFHVGQRVRARNINPPGHTRLPRYARGRVGTIERDHGVFVFSDTDAHGLGEKPQHVYSIRFTARELWGEQVSGRDSVYVDMWDDYLEPA
jgi:nitrile hydratase subunit beta